MSSIVGSESLPDDRERIENLVACLPALRIASLAIVVSLLWKIAYFIVFVRIYSSIPLEDDFFPVFLQSTGVAIAAYASGLFGASLLAVCSNKKWLNWSAVLAVGGTGVLCIHQQTYNDVTFLTCCWSAVWCWWFVNQLGQPAAALMRRAGLMAHLILSVIFLGGTAGKLTDGYWSGEVFFQIYFERRNFWLFNLIRSMVDESMLAEVARWYSRMVICTEGICTLLWLFPGRLASFVAIAVLCNIALMSNTLLFSVLTCLLGLAVAALHNPGNSRSGRALAANGNQEHLQSLQSSR